MYIARILYPVKVLGIGNRIGIWFCGCPRRCVGCSNPELWEYQDRYKTSIGTVMELINGIAAEHNVDGFTITGGEPFAQVDDLCELLQKITMISDDILVYTGYYKHELPSEWLSNIAVLIDAPYEKDKNDGAILRGSSNQSIYILQEKFRGIYGEYLATASNKIKNFAANDGCISVGIHRQDFKFT